MSHPRFPDMRCINCLLIKLYLQVAASSAVPHAVAKPESKGETEVGSESEADSESGSGSESETSDESGSEDGSQSQPSTSPQVVLQTSDSCLWCTCLFCILCL